MATYSTNPEEFPGSAEPPFYPLDVVDARGRVIDKPGIVFFDTLTGRVIRRIPMYTAGGTYLRQTATLMEYHPAPLTYRKYEGPMEAISLEDVGGYYPRCVVYERKEEAE